MNEHEKLEEALDLLESFVHRDRNANGPDRRIVASIWPCTAALELLEKCGRFRTIERKYGTVTGYWRDEDPERKAT